jgi:predicted DNA-binding mobile mystery protein A
MRAQNRILARKQLDKRLNPLRNIEFARPPRGWVKALREALGMTAEQLARRIGVSRPRVHKIEEAEVSGSITLNSLERAAQALDCRLVYAFVPRQPLETLIQQRALRLAKSRLRSTAHSMALEDQSVDQDDEQQQLIALAEELTQASGSKLWEDE